MIREAIIKYFQNYVRQNLHKHVQGILPIAKLWQSIFKRQIALSWTVVVDVTINSTSIKALLRVRNQPIIHFGKAYDVDNPSAHVDNDKNTHKDKDRRKLPRRR